MRATVDVDLYRARATDIAEADLRGAASRDIGDWFRFEIGPTRMTGEPEPVPPLARIVMPDIEQHGYRAYPLADHVADKVVATFQRYGPQHMPSTRYKDMVDLVAIVTGASLHAEAALRALASEARRRCVQLPTAFDVPDRGVWDSGYSAEARRTAFPVAATLDEALAIVGPCLDPLLNRSASGSWEPSKRQWQPK